MLAVRTDVDWGGRPLAKLHELVRKRVKMLVKETPENATIATAIDVLKSLRALALKAKTTPKTGVQFSVVDTGWVGGWKSRGDAGKAARFFRGTAKGLKLTASKYLQRCVRTARRKGAEVPDVYPIWLVGPGAFEKGKTVHVYRVTPRHAKSMKWEKNRNKGMWYIAAYSQPVAERFAANHLMRRYLKNTSGLARYALTRAMRALSTKNVAEMNQLSPRSKRVAEINVEVGRYGTEDGYTVLVKDDLAYAAKAFKRPDALNYAMAKAANSIAGMLRRRAHGLLDPAIETPFPEIVEQRRRA